MKAMWSAFAAIIVIAVLASFVLDTAGFSSTERFAGANTRPPAPNAGSR